MSDNKDDRIDPIRDLIRRRDDIEDRLHRARIAARREAGELGFWGLVGGAAIAADFMILGGVGTAIAIVSGVGFFGNSREAKKLQKSLDQLDSRIETLQREQVEWERKHPRPDNSLTDEFSPAAKREIDLLRARLEELEKQMDKAGKPVNDDSQLDKPKFKPPRNGF